MKTSLLLTALILAAAGLLGWRQQGQLTRVRETHQAALADARALGLAADDIAAGKIPLPAKRAREDAADRSAAAKAFAAELIAFAAEMKARQEAGDAMDAPMQKRIAELLVTLGEFDPAQIKILIAELRACDTLDRDMRRGVLGLAIMTLAERQPESALALFTESSDLVEAEGMMEHVLAQAIEKLAESNPNAALEWLRANGKKFPDLIGENTRLAVVAGAAKLDPKLALGLADELDLVDDNRAPQVAARLAAAATTAEERSALLAALRGAAENNDLVSATLTSLASGLANDGFDDASAWLATAKLDDAERESFLNGLGQYSMGEDTGKWLDWMGDQLPPDQQATRIGRIVGAWTTRDHQAAGEWIRQTSDGPVKETAVAAYAETVAPYEPAAAAQWALTLPAGERRTELIEQIHEEWKKKDEAAAADFAREHDLAE
jgi:hypothetical protein